MRLLTPARARQLPMDGAAGAPYLELPTSGAREGLHDVYRVALGAADPAGFAVAAGHLLAYRIFPPSRMRSAVLTADGRVAEGALVLQRIFVGPVALETAVRVVAVEQSSQRASFAYATLAGHPEQGVASFTVQSAAGPGEPQLELVIEAWSRAGHWLTRLGRPAARHLQRRSTHEALEHFRSLVLVRGG